MTETDTPTVDDYTAADAVGDGLIDRCAHCEQSFHPQSYHGEIVDTDGSHYDHLSQTDPGDRPFFCPECYEELKANEHRKTHQTLGEFQ
jgi:hypothetical protein